MSSRLLRFSIAACLAAATAGAPAPAPRAVAAPQLPDPEKVKTLRDRGREAAARLAEARAELDAAVAAYEHARTELERASARLAGAERRLGEARAQLSQARDQLDLRAGTIYRGRRINVLEAVLAVRSFADFLRVASLAAAVARRDTAVLRHVEGLRDRAEAAHAAVEREADARRRTAAELGRRQSALLRRMQSVAALVEKVRAELGTELGKFRFPVRPPYSYVDTYGAPRMTGTPYAHRHEGIDIFAPMGTPVVAVVTGSVFGVGQAVLGGNKLWVRGPDGHTYYYAHLRGFAPAARNGGRVEAGTALGYVGDTGNAKGTPPHLHFEIHAPSGSPINPFATLKSAERAWAAI